MFRFGRANLVILLAIAAALVGLLVLGRMLAQRINGLRSAIRGANGIEDGFFERIGGIDQWIQVRGEDRDNPVVLLLHGGPGVSYIPFGGCFRGWENDFTVVQWDQRGAGKTFGKNSQVQAEGLTIDRMVEDGIEVAEYLVRKFGRPIILFAHSWGSILGVRMAYRRPDLFSLYVGAGQVGSMPKGEAASYDLLHARIKASGDSKALKALESAGPPPYSDIKKWMVKQRMIVMTGPRPTTGKLPNMFTAPLFVPGYSLRDCLNWMRAFMFSVEKLFPEMMESEAIQDAPRLEIPVLFIQGDLDFQAPLSTLQDYYEALVAKDKKLIILEGESHTAILSSPDRFQQILKEETRQHL